MWFSVYLIPCCLVYLILDSGYYQPRQRQIMTKPNTRMTAMRQRALEAFADGRTDNLSEFSTTALWEVARVEHRKGNRHALARAMVELFNRVDANDGTGVPIELHIHLPECSVSDTGGLDLEPAPETMPARGSGVSDTVVLDLEPSRSSASKGKRGYPPEVKARAVLASQQGQGKGEVLALISSLMPDGRAPHDNYSKLVLKEWPNDSRVLALLGSEAGTC